MTQPTLSQVLAETFDPQRLRTQVWSEIATFSMLIAELSWIAAWYGAVLLSQGGWLPAYAVLGAVTLSTHILVRVLNALELPSLYRVPAVLLWIFFTILVTLKLLLYPDQPLGLGGLLYRSVQFLVDPNSDLREVFHHFILLLLILRGLRIAREPADTLTTAANFQLGLFMFLVFGLLLSGSPLAQRPQTYFALYLFLLFSLFAMFTARIASLRGLRGGRTPVFNRGWALGVLLIGLIVVAVGVFSGWVLSGQLGQWIVQLILALTGIITFLILLILSPLLLLLARWIPMLIARFQKNLADPINAWQQSMQEFLQHQSEQAAAHTEWVTTGRNLVVILFALIILASILAALRWRQLRIQAASEKGDPSGRLGPLTPWEFLTGRLRSSRDLNRARRLLAAARIRWVYAQFMDLCEDLGTPRPPALTPLEFIPRAAALFPDHLPALQTLTQAYLRVRYGELPETQKEIDDVTAAWESVEAAGKAQLQARRKLPKH